MALYKVVKPYRDYELDRVLEVGQEVEMTVKRAEEVAKVLKEKGHSDLFLERIQEEEAEEVEKPAKEQKKTAKEQKKTTKKKGK